MLSRKVKQINTYASQINEQNLYSKVVVNFNIIFHVLRNHKKKSTPSVKPHSLKIPETD